MHAPAEKAFFNWLETNLRRMTDQEVREEAVQKYLREHPGTPPTPVFMGLWKRWPI